MCGSFWEVDRLLDHNSLTLNRTGSISSLISAH